MDISYKVSTRPTSAAWAPIPAVNLGPATCALPTGLPDGAYTLQVKDATTTINKSFTLKPGAHAGTTWSGRRGLGG